MNNKKSIKLLVGLLLTLAASFVLADAGITSDDAGPHYSKFTNQETFEDLRVKVLGGHVRMTRRWDGESWVWNERWQDLEFYETGHLTGALGVWYSGSGTAGTVENPLEKIKANPPLFVFRSGQAYRRVPDDNQVVYENQLRNFIKRTDDGYKWSDASGNGIGYDIYGRIRSYHDKNNVDVFIDRDVNGYITQIRDHHGNVVITYQWEAIPNAGTRTNVEGDSYTPQRLTKISDYSGRSVVYHWNDDNQLANITDVLGQQWQLTYDEEGRLTTQTDPEGRQTHYNIGTDGQLNSRVNHDGVGSSYSYSYDKDEDIYYVMEKHTSGRVTETWYDAMGRATKASTNGDAKASTTTTLSDNSTGVKNLVKGYSTTRTHWYRGNTLVRTDTSVSSPITVNSTPIYIRSETKVDARGNKTTYEYDQWRNVTKVTYADGSTIKRTWDSKLNLPLTFTNERGVTTSYEYDEKGNLLTLVEAKDRPEERTTRYTYDDYGQQLSVTTGESAAGNTEHATTSYEYDSYGNITKVTDPIGNVTRFEDYDALGNAHTIIDARANELPVEQQYTWMREYDAAGNLLSELNPYGESTTYTYTKAGDLKTVTAINGSTTTVTSNASGLPTTVKDVNDNSVRLEYDKDGKPTAVIDQNGNTTRFGYNSDGRLSKLTDGEGNAITYDYTNTFLSSIQYPTYKEILAYDNRNRVQQVKQQANSREYLRKLGYDVTNNLSSRVDANGNSESYEYDALNRLITITDAIGGKTRFTYDARDNLVKVEDPEGRLTVYTYTKNDQQLTETKHDYIGTDMQRVYDYDASGNLISVTSPEQEKTTFEYDQANRRVKTAVYANKADARPVKVVNYHINEKNQLTGYTQQVGTSIDGGPHPKATPDILPLSETYTYTVLDQVESVTVDFGPFQKSYSYTYYPNGLKKTYTNPEAITYTYYYNKNNELAAVHIPGEGQLSYTDFKWLVPQTLVLPGGSRISLSYDDFLQVEQRILRDPANNDIAQALYEYGLESNIKKIATEHGDYLFGYDSLYRLTSADYDVQGGTSAAGAGSAGAAPEGVVANDESFGYDGVGNRTSHTVVSGEESEATTATYGNQNQLISESSGAEFTYNANGHTATESSDGVVTEYQYNHEERLVAVKVAGAVVGRYAFDPYGRRIRKVAGEQATYFLYNDEGLAAEYDANGSLLKEYHFKIGDPWMTNPLFQRTAEGDVFYYQNDHLGTPQRMVSASGAVVWEARYAAFGEAEVLVEQVSSNLRYPGQYYDEKTGHHYNWNRHYDPKVSRYLTSDPIGLRGGVNTFSYVFANPLKYIDPSGLCSCDLPNAQDFMDNYPDYDNFTGSDVWELVGGGLNDSYGPDSPGGTQNSCATRVSRGLNYSGAPIPPGTPGGNRNWGGDDNRYIISAQQMNNYLNDRYGAPSQTISGESGLESLQDSLGDGGVAIVSSGGHASVVTPNYNDPYVGYFGGEVWVLPGGNCICQ